MNVRQLKAALEGMPDDALVLVRCYTSEDDSLSQRPRLVHQNAKGTVIIEGNGNG